MKILRYESRLSVDDLELAEAPDPTPGARDVVVRVVAASLNFRDLAIARGAYGGLEAPLVPGSDAAGEVVAIGDAVRGVAVGDRVCVAYVLDWLDGPPRAEVIRRRLGGPVDGVLRERMVVDERALVKVPAGLTMAEAATLPVAGSTAWQALVVDARIGPGDTVAVTGTGGLAVFVVLVARLAGARCVVVGRRDEKLVRMRALGAETLNARNSPAWDEELRAMTEGEGVDVVVDGVGGSSFALALAAVRPGGRVVMAGFVAGANVELDLLAAIRRVVTLASVSGGSRASLEAFARALARSSLRPVIDRTFPFGLAGLRDALAYLAESEPLGKVVVDMEVAR